MLARLWTTKVRLDRTDQYERFACEISLPMFRQQEGFVGVVMTRAGEDCRVLTFWRDEASIAKLADSPTYKDTVRRIVAEGFLFGEQSVDVAGVHLMAFE